MAEHEEGVEARQVTRPTGETRDEAHRDAVRPAGADRSPTRDEERAAEAATEELDESGELDKIREHATEMNRRGASQRGEGRPG